jgi:ABC-type glycerol-3-phosphate transport system permease component
MNSRKLAASPTKIFITFLKLIPLVGFSLAAAYPVYYMVITSFKTRLDWLANQFSLPKHISFDNFVLAANTGNMLVWARNSLIVTSFSVVISTFLAVMAAFAVARMRFKGRQLYLNTMISLMVIPPAVLIVPLFDMMVKIGILNTYASVIFIYTGLLLPFSIFLLVSFFRGLPVELFDAASIDGCSSFGTLMRIVIPLSAPALVTLIVVNTLWVWNELLIALIFLQSNDLKTLMPGISQFKGRFNNNEPLVLTGAFLSSLPMIVLYLAGQRFFVRGMVAGAVK